MADDDPNGFDYDTIRMYFDIGNTQPNFDYTKLDAPPGQVMDRRNENALLGLFRDLEAEARNQFNVGDNMPDSGGNPFIQDMNKFIDNNHRDVLYEKLQGMHNTMTPNFKPSPYEFPGGNPMWPPHDFRHDETKIMPRKK